MAIKFEEIKNQADLDKAIKDDFDAETKKAKAIEVEITTQEKLEKLQVENEINKGVITKYETFLASVLNKKEVEATTKKTKFVSIYNKKAETEK